jgi:hypothetical protein
MLSELKGKESKTTSWQEMHFSSYFHPMLSYDRVVWLAACA